MDKRVDAAFRKAAKESKVHGSMIEVFDPNVGMIARESCRSAAEAKQKRSVYVAQLAAEILGLDLDGQRRLRIIARNDGILGAKSLAEKLVA
jgi:hypothetical protein